MAFTANGYNFGHFMANGSFLSIVIKRINFYSHFLRLTAKYFSVLRLITLRPSPKRGAKNLNSENTEYFFGGGGGRSEPLTPSLWIGCCI